MKKLIITLLLFFSSIVLKAQNHNPIINYFFNGTPQNGIKIKTNFPYTDGIHMPTLIIEGFNYGQSKTIGIILNWYIYRGQFIRYNATSFGAYTPEIKLLNESGKVVIFINDKQYYNRFTIRGYAKGMSENNTMFQNWSITDALPNGTKEKIVEYSSKLAGIVEFPGGVWNKSGNVGIGTTTPDAKLSVNGNIHTKEVKVDLNGWADFVFDKNYELPTLKEVEKHIEEKGYLADMPSAKEVKEKGVQLGEMNKKLLQKIEELTLYTIQQEKKLVNQEKKLQEMEVLKQENRDIKKRLFQIEKLLRKQN